MVGVLTAGSVTRNDRSTRRARGVHPTRHTIGHAGSAGRLLSIDVPSSARAALNGSGRHPPCPELGRPQAMGPGDAAGSAATDREAWFRSWSSVGGRPPHFAARCHVSQRCSVSGAGTTPLRFASSFIRFHGDLRDRSSSRNATGTRIGMTRAREPHCRVPSATVSRAQTRTFDAAESPNPRCGDRGNASRSRTARPSICRAPAREHPGNLARG